MTTAASSRYSTWLILALSTALAAACSSSDSPSPGGGAGGSAGSAGAAGAAGATLDGGADADAGPCHGDQAVWDSLTASPIACTKNSDCCVIVNGCYSSTQVVAAAHKDEAKSAWPTCDDKCNACIPPPTEVGCVNGTCTGTTVDFADAAQELMQDHCGVDGPTVLVGGLHFGCGP